MTLDLVRAKVLKNAPPNLVRVGFGLFVVLCILFIGLAVTPGAGNPPCIV